MLDRLLEKLLNLMVVTLISICAGVSLITGYNGLFQLLGSKLLSALLQAIVSMCFALASWILVSNRNDLVDDWRSAGVQRST